jgi:hypothetical protein
LTATQKTREFNLFIFAKIHYLCKKFTMAIAIKSIPVLKHRTAKSFVKKANDSLSRRASVDFSKQLESAKRILEKAKTK